MTRRTIIISAVSVVFTATTVAVASGLHAKKGKTKKPDAVTPAADTSKAKEAISVRPTVVRTATVESRDLTEYVVAEGVTTAHKEVTFSAEIAGKIEAMSAEVGKRVRRGQVLARIDTTTLTASRAQAKASFDLAEATYERFASLGPEIVSRQTLDEAHSALLNAKAALEIADDQLSKSLVRSNISGIANVVYRDKAEYATPGAPIVHVVDYSTIVVEAQLAETEVVRVGKDEPVLVYVDALGESFEGVVDAILPKADPASKTFTLRVNIDNSDLRILVGMAATLKVAARVHRDAVVVPQDMIIEGQGGRRVFVADGDRAVERSVRLGPTDGNEVAVVDGLRPGETLIVLGHRNLSDGQPITRVQ
jgi:membrane fusion protein (multidrug efflux system)